ncbi:hypothetical protein EVAR_25040_1 [Eumeta japonica]|uniref:Uncharacterized protein n=1 Tax=Eumeta variegata TaxID=151549 RepID=A0A4C1V7Z2_EUMVA|nr:hypothetical protein EVAR_25040_1 [Eumeta japonica]
MQRRCSRTTFYYILEGQRGVWVIREQVVTITHEHPHLQNDQCVTRFLGRHRIAGGRESGLMEAQIKFRLDDKEQKRMRATNKYVLLLKIPLLTFIENIADRKSFQRPTVRGRQPPSNGAGCISGKRNDDGNQRQE